jgi:hypothetical protein
VAKGWGIPKIEEFKEDKLEAKSPFKTFLNASHIKENFHGQKATSSEATSQAPSTISSTKKPQ